MSIANEQGGGGEISSGQQEASTEGMANAGSKVGDGVRQFAGEAKQYASQKAGEVKDQANAALQQGRERAQELYDQGLRQAHDLYDQSKERLHGFEEQVEQYVREKPVQSVLIAAGVGLALGLLLRK